MGVMYQKEDRDTDLNRRISADLRARAQDSEREDPDFGENSEYTKNTKKTGKFTWVWIVLIILAIISLICIIFI